VLFKVHNSVVIVKNHRGVKHKNLTRGLNGSRHGMEGSLGLI
jgi:hypothetical protein